MATGSSAYARHETRRGRSLGSQPSGRRQDLGEGPGWLSVGTRSCDRHACRARRNSCRNVASVHRTSWGEESRSLDADERG
jgi:hypothetical protein